MSPPSDNPFATPGAVDAPPPTYTSGPVRADLRPIELLKEAKEMIGDQYWTFFGVAGLGLLIGSAAPFGIVMGPMMCGIYMCFLARARGETVELGMLFKGFDFFKPSFFATMIMVGAMFAVMIPMGGGLAFLAYSAGEAAFMPAIFGFYALILVISIGFGMFTMFAYPLIADRGYQAVDALKTSFAATSMNLGGMATMMVVYTGISIFLMLFCYVPAFFFIPLTFGAYALAYRRIFPDA